MIEKIILVLLFPIAFPIALCTWILGVIWHFIVKIYKWTYPWL